jgi:hypothetical protein
MNMQEINNIIIMKINLEDKIKNSWEGSNNLIYIHRKTIIMIIEEEEIILRMAIKIYTIGIIVICMMASISNLINRNSSIINNIIQINNK